MNSIARLAFFLFVCGIAAACRPNVSNGPQQPVPSGPVPLSYALDTNIRHWFSGTELTGSFSLLDLSQHTILSNDSSRARLGRLPASTFKIFNSLVILEEEVAQVSDTLPWDGVKRGWKKWDRAQTMDSAMRYSSVWYYQEMARRVGRERMEFWLEQEEYGNTKTGPEIDMFWLTGDIRVSPEDQLTFLRKLAGRRLGFRPETQSEVIRIMQREAPDGYALHSKTGWAVTDSMSWCWNVGLLFHQQDTFAYALEFDLLTEGDEKWRNEGHLELLKILGILPE